MASGPLRVDTYQAAPADMARFAEMNPFYFDPDRRIPVPGQPGLFSSSMEAVWQGLKYVDGETDMAQFDLPPYKRPPDEERTERYHYAGTRFLLGDKLVDIITARYFIYLPAYLHVLNHFVSETVVSEISGALGAGRDVVFYDWDDNFDIHDPGTSFSHSAILAAWFGGTLDTELLEPFRLWGTGLADLAPFRTSLPTARYRAIHRTEQSI